MNSIVVSNSFDVNTSSGVQCDNIAFISKTIADDVRILR